MKNYGLSASEIESVLNFEGYGNKSAPYWFLGMEEGGGSIEQLQTRAGVFKPVEELNRAISILGYDITKYHSTLRVMSMVMLAMNDTPEWWEFPKAQEYQEAKLGRYNGETFLTDLMPLPCKNLNDWPYPDLFPTKAEYIAKIRPDRIRWLRAEISAFKPPFVFCYGKGNWRYYEEIFSDVEFKPAFNTEIRVGVRGNSQIILLKFLSPDLVKTDLIDQIAGKFGRKAQQH